MARRVIPKIVRKVPPRAALGECLMGELAITNPTSRQLRIETQQPYPEGMMGNEAAFLLSIPAGNTAVQPFAVTLQALGRLEWQSLYTRSLGQFGLAWWPRRISLPGTVQVVPARLRSKERPLEVQKGGNLARRGLGVGTELHGLRDYRPGDPLRAMDWKATARSGRHTVRVFMEEQHLELMLLIDAGRTSSLQTGPLTRLNHYANCAARLAENAVSHGDQVGMVVFAETPIQVLPPLKGSGALLHVRAALERMRPVLCDANPLSAVLLTRKLMKRRSLVVLFTDIDENEDASQLVKATALLAPKHLPVIAGILDEEILSLQRHRAAHWLDPFHAFAASETLQASQGAALRLQRMGAFVALASPSQLDGKVMHFYRELRNRKQV
ncbi:MAG TPA: DUF58 domain-containing protein [Nitrospira sp.]|nr:DUF58 domain-containing protein [Nitrospira sp.]